MKKKFNEQPVTSEVANYRATIAGLRSDLSAAEKERDDLKAKLAVAVEALEFYGARFNWHKKHQIERCVEYSCCHNDRGKRAREALKAIND